ncbi:MULTISPECIES: (2Fe-2S)-binding protein [unclassified Blastococcus]
MRRRPRRRPVPPAVRLVVDGTAVETPAAPGEPLLAVLRDRLGVTSAKGGCWRGECGTCTVLLDGAPVLACVTLAEQAAGGEVTTAAGVTRADPALAAAFADAGGLQCGFCTPGQVVRAAAVLAEGVPTDDAGLACAMAGNVCRCTGYAQILDAVRTAAAGRA